MTEHIFMQIAIIAIVLAPVILEAYGNVINPVPKMEDRNEERKFGKTICKTREMFEVTKR